MKRVLFVALALIVLTSAALAQSNSGRLVGAVSDPSGVIPGATVVVTDNKTGKERTVVASDDGSFTVPQLEPGTYTVRITAAGHKTFSANEVKIDVGRDYTLNASLEVGDVSATVEVVAGADVVNASNAELSTTVSARQIQDLPLNGRDPTTLILLQAGTASNGATTTSINGQRSAFTNITRDGINIQDNYIRANASDFTPQRPTVDDVAEFTITTQNASADQGYGASQVSFATPRGQNEFHGALFEFNRNSKFAANEFFNNASGIAKPFLNRNQFGGRISGPILKNKLFFFVANEYFILRTQSSELRTILTPNARNGIFTYTAACNNTTNPCPAGVTPGQQLSVNLFSLPIAGANAPTGINPLIASRILANMPAAGNSTGRGDQRNTTGFQFNQGAPYGRKGITTRIDYDVNGNNTINGVYSFTRESPVARNDVDRGEANAAGTVVGGGFGQLPVIDQPSDREFLALAWRTTLSPTFTNEVRGGFFKQNPTFNRLIGEPDFLLSLPIVSSPEVNFEAQGRGSNTYSLQDNADYIWGDHSLRFGGQYQAFRITPFSSFDTRPRYLLGTSQTTPQISTAQFTNNTLFPGQVPSAQRATANAIYALLGGIIGSATQTFNATSQTSGYVNGAPFNQEYSYDNYGFYISDQWRVSPTFTLNAGLRYELFTALRATNGLALEPVIPEGSNVVSTLLNPVGTVQFAGGNSGGGNKLFNADKNNFGPVISFAWTPQFKNKFAGMLFGEGGRTVIRGGYRKSFVNDDYLKVADNAASGNSGLSQAVTLQNLNGRLGGALPPVATPTFPTFPRTFAAGNAASGNFFNTVFGITPDIQVASTNEINFGIQREIGFQTALEVRYVHGWSNNLWRGTDFNQLNLPSEFLADFNRARANLVAGFTNPNCAAGATVNGVACQPLTFFPTRIEAGGLLTNATIQNRLIAGTPADLAVDYITNFFFSNGTTPHDLAAELFIPNYNAGPVDVIGNTGSYNYNGLQIEARRRFSGGLYFQANYTFQKTLSNASNGNTNAGQTRFEPNLANQFPELEYARADYDQTHVFNFNGIYELPFGKGKRWLNEGNWINRVFGGFQIGSIVNISSGAPISIIDARGTLNRVGRSGRQTAVSNLTKDQIKDLIGIFKTPNGVFFINPSVIDPTTGAAANGYGSPAFSGQVFFNAAPGQTGNLERSFINGPLYVNWDAALLKRIAITERVNFQLRFEAFNLLNRANFFAGQRSTLNINSTNFGRLVTTFSPRIIQFGARLEF
jgi:hypothetical protein